MVEHRQRDPSRKPEHPQDGIEREDGERMRGARCKARCEREVEDAEEGEKGDEKKVVDLRGRGGPNGVLIVPRDFCSGE